ncbi:MAG: hypothetical protein U0228_04125 [Myxococcaceae bacterium]
MFAPTPALQQGFQFLSRTELDQQLSAIFRHWDASPELRAEFVGWAWVVAAASDFTAVTEGQLSAADQVREERDQVHRQIAEKLHLTARVDLELVSRRMFLDWLCSEMRVLRAAA